MFFAGFLNAANPTFTLTSGYKNATTGFNCESVSFDFSNTSTSNVYFQIYQGPLNSRDFTQFENISSPFGSDNILSANSTIVKSTSDIGSFSYMVRFFINSSYTGQIGADQFIDVIVASAPQVQFMTSDHINNCENDGVIIGLQSSESGVNYQMYFDNGISNTSLGSTVSGTGNAISFPAQNTKGIYTITGINATSGCTSQMYDNITILEKRSVSVTISTPLNPICSGNNATFSVSSIANQGTNPTYQWKINGNNVGSNTSSFSSTTLINGDIISLQLTSNDNYVCLIGSPAISNLITMSVGNSVYADVTINANANPICAGQTISFTTSTQYGGTAPTFQWYKDGNPISGQTNSSFSSSNLINGDKITVIMTSNYLPSACLYNSPKTSNEVAVIVNPLPVLTRLDAIENSSNTNNDGQICSDASATLTPVIGSGTFNDFRFLWSAPGSITISETSSTYQTTIGSGAGNYSLQIENITTGCRSSTVSKTITIFTIPSVGSISGPTSQVCVGKQITLTSSGHSGGTTPYTAYWWYTGDAIGGTTTSTTVTVNGVSAGSGEVKYSVEDSKKCMSERSAAFIVTVNPLPAKPTAVSTTSVYDGNQHLADASVTGSNVVRDWYNSSGSISQQPVQTIVGSNTQYAEARNSITGCVSASREQVTAEVTKATLTLTAVDKQKIYNKAVYSGGYSMSSVGFAINESFGNLSGTATYSGTSQAAINVGTYSIIPSGYSSSNYNINYVNGTLTINKKDIGVQSTSVLSKVYDATTSATLTGSTFLTAINAGTGTSTDLKPYTGDVIFLATSASFQDENVGNSKPVNATYSFSSSSTDAGNYNLIQPTGLTGQITPKTIDEVNANTQSKVYDRTPISVGYTSSLRDAIEPGSGNSGDKTPYLRDDIVLVSSAEFLAVDVTNSGAISSTSTLSGSDKDNYVLTRAINLTPRAISRKNLTMSGLSVPSSKIYDGTMSTTINGSPGLLQAAEEGAINTSDDGKPYTGDDVNLTGNASATYNSKDVLTASFVVYSGISLTGSKAGNYSLTIQANDPATITPKALTFSGLSVPSSKVYNGNRSADVAGSPGVLQTSIAAGSGSSSDGKPYSGDQVNLTGTAIGTYNTKDVATATVVSFSGISLAGQQSSNYSLTPHTTQNASITVKTITITGAVASNKVYDATTVAKVTNGQLQGVESIDALTVVLKQAGIFASKDVGVNIGVTSDCSISGADATNYSLTQPILASKNITKKELTMSGLTVPATKIYDATTKVIVGGAATLKSAIAPGTGTDDDGTPYTGDLVNIIGTVVGTYNSKDVNTASKVTFSGLSLSGLQSINYNLKIQEPSISAITKKKLTMFGLSVADTKVYDGNRNAKVLGTSFLQTAQAPGTGTTEDGKPYIGDIVNVDGAPTALYNSKNVVEANKVSFAGLSVSGAQSDNYDLVIQDDYPAKITPLNINVTADKQTKVYGDSDPLYTYTNDPLISGDSFTGLLSRVEGQNVGAYAILLGTLDLGTNYTITYTSSNLVITEASMYIKPDTTYRTYGDQPNTDGLTTSKFIATGLKYNETVKYVKLYFPVGLGSGNDPRDSVGVYSFGVRAKDPFGGTALASNYKIVSFPGDIRIKPLPITITADSKTKRQSEADPIFTYKLSINPINGDTVSGNLIREPGELPGTYPIRQGTLAINKNYEITYYYDMLTVLTVENIFVVPNAFTPNSDGLNDLLKILHNSSVVGVNYFQIFNKAGKLVFETKNIEQGWDGRLNGLMQESDVYYWFAEFKTWNNLNIQRKGTVVLLK
jgi:gliding motility-associated-like protein